MGKTYCFNLYFLINKVDYYLHTHIFIICSPALCLLLNFRVVFLFLIE